MTAKKRTPLETRRQQDNKESMFGKDAKPIVIEKVKHPNHYNWHPTGVEAIVIAREFSFDIGSAMTYLWRSAHKGTPIEDLKKAIFHIVDEIDRIEQAAGVKPRERHVFNKHGGKLS